MEKPSSLMQIYVGKGDKSNNQKVKQPASSVIIRDLLITRIGGVTFHA